MDAHYRPKAGWSVPGTASILAIVLIAACSGQQARASQADLVAAVKARLTAESSGFASGNPAMAASLSTGDAATTDQTDATSIAGQISSGDTTDYAFDILNVEAYPLDWGNNDFIAFETVRAHSDGSISRAVELYHRNTPADRWKATVQASFNANIDLPQLKLNDKGAHLLTAADMPSALSQPSAVASRYATAMNDGIGSGTLDAGSFVSSYATTGAVRSEANFISQYSSIGAGSAKWTALPDGEAVALANGDMVFASVDETETIQAKVEGTLRYFTTQDARRLEFGGLLAPGNYTHISQTFLVNLVVVVNRPGPPDVVAYGNTQIAIAGVPF